MLGTHMLLPGEGAKSSMPQQENGFAYSDVPGFGRSSISKVFCSK